MLTRIGRLLLMVL